MELSNLSFEELKQFVKLNDQSQDQYNDKVKAKLALKIDDLNKLYPSILFKSLLPSIYEVNFSNIKIRNLGICIANERAYENYVPSGSIVICFELRFGLNDIDFYYDRATGMLCRIKYNHKHDSYVIKNIIEETPYSTFKQYIDDDFYFDLANAHYVVKQANINNKEYIKIFTPLIKAIYKSNATITYPTDVEEDLETIENFIDKEINLNINMALNFHAPSDMILAFKSSIVSHSFLIWNEFIAYFDEYFNITHVGVNINNNHHMINVYNEPETMDALDKLMEKRLRVNKFSILEKFSQELLSLTGCLDT